MTTPTSPSTGQPASFKTNINRAKTKRWVEAKSYSYDGDDWGDSGDDEYDTPEPSSHPPQAVPPRQGGFSGPYPQSTDRGRFDDMGFQPGFSQTPRGVSNPTSRTSPSRQSFDRGGDRRTYSLNSQSGFSDGPYPGQNRPPFAPSDHFGPPRMGPPRSPRNQSPLRVDTGQRRPSMTRDPYPHAPFQDANSGRSSSPFRPDSRGGAYPDVRGGPYPQPRPGPYGEPRGRPFPGPPPPQGRRSESRGRPSQAEIMGRRESPGRPPFGPPPGGPYPGYRPSMDSSRDSSPVRKVAPRKSSLSQEQAPYDPSATAGGPPAGRDRSQSEVKPVKSLPFIRPADIYKRMEEEREKERRQSQESSRPSIDIQTPKPRDSAASVGQRSSGEAPGRAPAKPESNTVEDDGRRSKPMLEPVSERKSEYGFDDILKRAPSDHPSVSQPPAPAQSQPLSREPSQPLSASSTYTDRPDPISASSSKRSYRGLPDVRGVSDFGDDFFRQQSDDGPYSSAQQTPRSADPERFNRAVNQAFEESQNLNPQTSLSSLGDSVVRSTSENTSDVSPIISRTSSNAAGGIRTTVVQAEPTIAEEPSEATPRPESSHTLKAPFTDRESKDLPELPRSTFRRSTDSPSPSGSPARRPQSREASGIPETEAAEIATATPVDERPSQPTHASRQGDIRPSETGPPDFASPRIPRAESPTKGTVRGLTDRFEGSGRSSPSGSPERSAEPPRPSNARLESFRPSLPGGWSSYTTNDGVSTPTQEDQASAREPTLAELRQQEADQEKWEPSPRPVSQHDAGKDDHEPSKKAFAAAAAAGSALAGAFAAITGSHDDGPHPDNEPSDVVKPSASYPERSVESEPPSSGEPNQPSNMNPVSREAISSASSVPPTPPPKDTQEAESRQVSGDASYFPSPLRASRTHEEKTETPVRPHIVPSLSTETSPQDDENDRLRKEIVKSLSPQTSAFDQARFSDSPTALEVPPANRSQVESSLLPKEYDSYWNEVGPEESQPTPAPDTSAPLEDDRPTPQPIEEAEPVEQTERPRRTLKKKFSWESSDTEEEPNPAPAVEPSWASNPQNEASVPLSTHMQATEAEHDLPPTREDPPVSEPTDVSREPFSEEAAPPPALTVEGPEETVSRDTTPRPIERELPPQTTDATEEPTSQPRPLSGEPKIRSFREILAMKTTPERIDAYNQARGQFASIDTGLSDWMQTVGQQHPEHADMVAKHGRLAPHEVEALLGHKLSPSRMKFPRIVSLNTAIPQTEDGTDSASGGKMSREQLLLSAGKIGGMAGGAAKGLFHKGKNKFRGSGGGDKAFFALRRRSQPAEQAQQQPESQPVVVVTEAAPRSGEVPPPDQREPGATPDENDTWSLSYAPTERHSAEKPRRSTSGPRELGSLAPPPYQSKTSPENASQAQPPVPPLPVQIPSPRISAFVSADDSETPSFSVSQASPPLNLDEREGEPTTVPQSEPVTSGPKEDGFHGEREATRQPRKFSWETSNPSLSTNEHAGQQTTEAVPVEEPSSIESPSYVPEDRDRASDNHGDIEAAAQPPIEQVKATEEENVENRVPVDDVPEQPLSSADTVERPRSNLLAEEPPTSASPIVSEDRDVHATAYGGISPALHPAFRNDPTESKANVDPSHPDVTAAVDTPESKALDEQPTTDVPRRFSFDDDREREALKSPPYTESPNFQGLIEKETGVGGAGEDPEKAKTKRPPSFSRPFGPPNIQEHPAFRASPEPDRRSQVYASEDVEHSNYPKNPHMRHSSEALRPDDEGYRIPGPYGQHFKSRQPPPPPSSYRPPRQYEPPTQVQPYQPRHSPERPFDLRPMTTEYTLPGMEPPPPMVEDPRRRSGVTLPGRTKPRTPILEDDDDDFMEERVVSERVKKRPGFLRKDRGLSDGHRARLAASSNDPNDRLGQMMSPSPVSGYPDSPGKKQKKLKRASTSDPPVAEGGKRSSFARLSGLFSRSSKSPASPVMQTSSNHPNVLTKAEPPTSIPPQDPYPPQNFPSVDFRGRPPPPEGYYGSPPAFREGSVGRAYRHPDEKGLGALPSPQRPVQYPGDPSQQGPIYPGPNRPVRVSPYDANNSSMRPYGYHVPPGSRWDPAQHAVDLHKRSRSPRVDQTTYDNKQNDQTQDPAHNLGTFNESGRPNISAHGNGLSRNDGQETPWRLDLPADDPGHSGAHDHRYPNGNDSGVHMDSRDGSGDRRSQAGNGRQSSPYSASPHGASRNDPTASQDEDEDLYNDGGYGPPRRPRQKSGNHLRPDSTQETVNSSRSSSSKHSQNQSARERHQQQALYELQGSRAPGHPESDEEDNIVMSPTSYPGQEWMPVVDFGRGEGLRGWDD